MFDGSSWQQGISLIAYVIYQTIIVMPLIIATGKYNNSSGVFYFTAARYQFCRL